MRKATKQPNTLQANLKDSSPSNLLLNFFYEGGLSKFELNTLPALLRHLARLHPNSSIRLKSIQETGGGARVSIVVENADSTTFEEIKAEAYRAHVAQIAIRDDRILQLEIERRLLLDEVFPRMLASAGHQVHIAGPATGVLIASGNASINAPVSANDFSAILPVLDAILNRRAELAKHDREQLENAIQSVKQEAQKAEPKHPMISEGLKIVRDIAVKAAATSAEKADWHAIINRLSHLL
jgi:hypothetical protein